MKRQLPLLLLAALTLALSPGPGRAEPPLYAEKNAAQPNFAWIPEILKQVPPLKHDRGNRWPMLLFEAGSFEPQTPEVQKALLARGLVQPLQMTTNHLPLAKALQAVGSPVIMMQGSGGPWPNQLAGDPKDWAHQFDAGYKPEGYTRPCLALFKGWAIEADEIRRTLRAYQAAGVTVDGVWMDWEGDPLEGGDSYEQARHCSRCRATLPAAVLASAEAFHAYRIRLCTDLLATYLVAPVREVFPKCETTNWMVTLSTPDRPLRFWNDRVCRPTVPGLFSATNPVAYGNTVYWHRWQKAWPVDREHVDQFYFHLLIRMVSDDQANVARWAPYLNCLPWIDRWCPDDEDPKIPIMTRERYREVLRHLWLRGVDGMQIFQPRRPLYEAICVSEVQDAVAVYDELLVYREFLDGGVPVNFEVPRPQDDGVVWSGLRLGDRALVRTFKQGSGRATFSVELWPGDRRVLEATPAGKTYVFTKKGVKATGGR